MSGATKVVVPVKSKTTMPFFQVLIPAPSTISRAKHSINAPPGTVENRVFVGGNYAFMPILRLIESVAQFYGFQPIVPLDFDIPKEKTRDYTLRLMFQCKYAIFEVTLPNGHLVEIARATGFQEMNILQVYMAMDKRKNPPKTMSIMVWQTSPPPQGYLTISELIELVMTFLKNIEG